MKTPSDQLFTFIYSLEAHEKAFIKRHLSINLTDSRNEQLFDYLCSIDMYDEQKLLKSLRFLNKKNVTHYKHQLYDYLLVKLELYHSETDEEQKLYKVLFQVRLLHKKKQYQKAQQLLEFAIKKAKQYNFFLLQTQLEDEQECLAIDAVNLKKYDLVKKQNETLIPHLLGHYQDELFYRKQIYELTKLQLIKLSAEEREKKIRQIHNEVLHKKNKTTLILEPKQIQVKIAFIESLCFYRLSDYENAKKLLKIVLLHDKQNSLNLVDQHSQTLLHLINAAAICLNTNDEKWLLDIDQQTDTVYESIALKKRDSLIMDYYFGIKMNVVGHFINCEQFDSAKKASEKLWKQLNPKLLRSDLQKIFTGNLCQIYLCCGETRKALGCYTKLINTSLREVRKDIDSYISILGLAIFYDLNYINNMESLIRKCKRDKFYKQQCLIYQRLITFFDHLTSTINTIKLIKLFTTMVQEINAVKPTDKESTLLLNSIPIHYWLTNKLK